ncbi:hypothetical protein ACYSNX_00530 [Myroides sp. LJL115]
MNKRNISTLKTVFFLVLLMTTSAVLGQSKSSKSDLLRDNKPFSHMALSAGFSTLGTTIEVSTPVAKRLKLRAGVDFFKYNTKQFSMDLQDPNGVLKEYFHTEPKLRTKANIHLFHAHLLVDYYVFEKSIFYISAGVYLGNTKFGTKGRLEDQYGNLIELKPGKDWPEIIFDGKKLEVIQAKVDAELKLGDVVKPYLGIGIGRAIPKNRFGIKAELGIIYQGAYSIYQNGQKLPTLTRSELYIEDSQKYTKWLKWWPKASIQLSYRLF